MKSLCRIALFTVLSAIGLGGVASSASAETIWNLDMHHNQTHFPPGGQGEIWFDINNVGATPSGGEVRLTIALPTGMRRSFINTEPFGASWNCPGGAGDSTVTCTTTGSITRHHIDRAELRLTVDVNAPEGVVRTVSARLGGGGAARDVLAREPIRVSATPAPFGVIEESFIPDFTESNGLTPEREAGSHPALLTTPFDFTTMSAPAPGQPNRAVPAESIRNLVVDLPPGFVGAPTAVGECTAALLTAGQCPPSSQVGRVDAFALGKPLGEPVSTGVFNMVHPLGVASDLAGSIAANAFHIRAFLDPARNYAITTEVRNINDTFPIMYQRLTVWGVPADPAHDSERCFEFSDFRGHGLTGRECAAGIPQKPFITFPSECGVDHQFRVHSYDSWQDSGDFGPDIVAGLPAARDSPLDRQSSDCHKPKFEPRVEIVPTGKEAGTPTGIDVSIEVPQNESAVALATPPVKSTVVTFPRGMTVNPAFADGLNGCTLGQIALGTNNPVRCPDNSRIGEVHMTSSLLPKPLEGSMYLAEQGDNAFGSTFAMYLAIQDTEQRGVLVKVPGRIDLDPTTGQMTTSFDDLPQFPFDTFTLSFRSGQRAPLANPPTCGTHRIDVAVTSYAMPDEIVDESNTYVVNRGPNGSPCAASSASRPFDPKMRAGTLNPTAGSHSPFVFRLTRSDTEQDISLVNTSLPPGMIAKLAGVATCPDSAIAQISTQEGTGQAEFDNPHCPANSLIGVLNAGVGAGTSPNYFGGKVYLAGPYKGAPLSLAAVVPAIAGPYDFGSVVVRIAADLDPRTTQVKAVSDPFPQIVHGVLLHVRDIRLNLNRDQFTLNPTNCSPMGINAEIFSDLGALATPSSRFQVGECGSLGFKPNLRLVLKGGTKRGAHPQLTATLTPRAGDANIASVSVAFPKSEFLENAHIRTVCTRADFAASTCPAGAIYGRATAYTPLLDYPFEANVYLRSSSNLLPDVVPDFRGPQFQPIKFESAGRVDSVNGGIRNTFDFIPDAPITRVIFALQGGRKGLLVNSRDICRRVYRATVRYTAHNGARYTQRPKMIASCGKAKRGKRANRSTALARSARVR